MIAGAAAEVPPGARLKVAMKNRRGKMRAVVTEVIEQTTHGVIVRTRPATKEEQNEGRRAGVSEKSGSGIAA